MYFICTVCILLSAANGVINDDDNTPREISICLSLSEKMKLHQFSHLSWNYLNFYVVRKWSVLF